MMRTAETTSPAPTPRPSPSQMVLLVAVADFEPFDFAVPDLPLPSPRHEHLERTRTRFGDRTERGLSGHRHPYTVAHVLREYGAARGKGRRSAQPRSSFQRCVRMSCCLPCAGGGGPAMAGEHRIYVAGARSLQQPGRRIGVSRRQPGGQYPSASSLNARTSASTPSSPRPSSAAITTRHPGGPLPPPPWRADGQRHWAEEQRGAKRSSPDASPLECRRILSTGRWRSVISPRVRRVPPRARAPGPATSLVIGSNPPVHLCTRRPPRVHQERSGQAEETVLVRDLPGGVVIDGEVDAEFVQELADRLARATVVHTDPDDLEPHGRRSCRATAGARASRAGTGRTRWPQMLSM